MKLHYSFENIKAKDTYCDESLVETVKAQIPDEPPIGKRWDKPKVEVRDHHEWRAAHHPIEKKRTQNAIKYNQHAHDSKCGKTYFWDCISGKS